MHLLTNMVLMLSATMIVTLGIEEILEILKSSLEDPRDENEGSGDVCNVDGSTCPDEKCCREDICKTDGHGLICCNDPDDNPVECANCPKCSKY